MKKKILLLGASGSIGCSALDIISRYPEHFDIVGLSARGSYDAIKNIAKDYPLADLHIFDEALALPSSVLRGKHGLQKLCEKECDIVINAISGQDGYLATEYIQKRKHITLLLANKESILLGGKDLIFSLKNQNIDLYPVDSEHASISYLLERVDRSQVKKIWLTASGGPFWDTEKYPLSSFSDITKEQALSHPRWKMGSKISIDSATMMNKAFELIEACYLFDLFPDMFRVLVHPQSIVHAAIEMNDGSTIIDTSAPDMRIPIARALFSSLSQEVPQEFGIPNFDPIGMNLSFFDEDSLRFPSLDLARIVLSQGPDAVKKLLEENDKRVDAFLHGDISFDQIFQSREDFL